MNFRPLFSSSSSSKNISLALIRVALVGDTYFPEKNVNVRNYGHLCNVKTILRTNLRPNQESKNASHSQTRLRQKSVFFLGLE